MSTTTTCTGRTGHRHGRPDDQPPTDDERTEHGPTPRPARGLLHEYRRNRVNPAFLERTASLEESLPKNGRVSGRNQFIAADLLLHARRKPLILRWRCG